MGYTIKRRSLLAGFGAVTVGALLNSCRAQNRATLTAAVLENAVPSQLLTAFERTLQGDMVLQVATKGQLADLFEQLQTWHATEAPAAKAALPSTTQADVVALADYWLQPAIQQGLIQPMTPAALASWSDLDARWQRLVTRDRQGNISPSGEVWGAPYRWGSLMMAYRKADFEKLGWQPQDWVDLWRPELQRQISLLDSPRSVIGLTLKMLGYGFNESNPEAIADLGPALASLNQQVKFYSSDAYLQPLIIGDTFLAVGWSTDILPILERNKDLAAVVPSSGTLLSTDLWVMPAKGTNAAPLPDTVQQWIEFYWQPEIAEQLTLLSYGTSPVVTNRDRATLSATLQSETLLLPSADLLNQSDLLEPLPEAAIAQYKTLWTNMRGNVAPRS